MWSDAMTRQFGGLDRRIRLALVGGLVVVLAAVALPAFAANPDTGPAGGNGQRGPITAEKSPNPNAAKAKKARVPKEPITLTGTVRAATDADGNAEYRLSSGGTTYTLDAGPAWFHGDSHPLAAYVGESVTIVGEIAEGSTDVEVSTVDGTAIRPAGKPPWAGGWKRVGEAHPGWSQEKADRMAEKAERMKEKFGGCFPPRACRDATAAE
jgi:hypothetical protein